MYKYVKAYLFKEETVVVEKTDIKNAEDDEFRVVSLLLPSEFIQEYAEELQHIEYDEEE